MEGWPKEEKPAGPGALHTAAVAAATGYSVQQIRDLERIGVIAPAERSDHGYRRFSARHVLELGAYRDLPSPSDR